MSDMDIDELLTDGSTQGFSRPGRFAPKGSKFKPKSEPEPSQSASDTVQPKKEGVIDVAMDMDVQLKRENGVKKEEEKLAEELTEGEDEVVREIDVYFNPHIDPETRLYVLQYPLRPSWRQYELDERCEKVRVKPASSEVEIDLAVDVDSKNYDSGADPRLQMKKQTLATSWKPPPASGYAVGVLTDNKLHLNPIHAVIQLRPSMKYLDADKESKRKSLVPSNVEDPVKAEDSLEVKPSGSSRKQKKVTEQNKDSGEGWVPLKYHGLRSDMSTGYLQKMMACDDSQIQFSMSSHDYLNSLCPGTSKDDYSSKGPSKRFLLSLPLEERFKNWLVEGAPIHRFDALKYLAPHESIEEVLQVLQEHARLIHGLWVPKSRTVFGTETGLQAFARNYVLLLFSKNTIVSDSQLPQRPQLTKAMKEVLNVLAVERPAFRDWKLKELPDTNFIRSYPSIVKKQEEEWEGLEKNINDFLAGGKSGPKPPSKSNTISNSVTSKTSNKLASRPQNGVPSRNAMPEDVRESVIKALQRLFKSMKVCSLQKISRSLKHMGVSEAKRSLGLANESYAAADSIDAFPDELQSIVSEVAVIVHGICVPKSSPDHPQYDSFRKVVIDLFIAEGPNAKLKRAPIIEAAKLELKRDIPSNEYNKVLQELCISQGSAWVLRTGEEHPTQ